MFAQVKLVVGEAESLEDAVARVARFVRPDGTVEVVEDSLRPIDEMRRMLGLPTSSRLRPEAVKAVLVAQGRAVTEARDPVLMPQESTAMAVLSELRNGHAVLWGGGGARAPSMGRPSAQYSGHLSRILCMGISSWRASTASGLPSMPSTERKTSSAVRCSCLRWPSRNRDVACSRTWPLR